MRPLAFQPIQTSHMFISPTPSGRGLGKVSSLYSIIIDCYSCCVNCTPLTAFHSTEVFMYLKIFSMVCETTIIACLQQTCLIRCLVAMLIEVVDDVSFVAVLVAPSKTHAQNGYRFQYR
jgi:hypothetical protein